MKTQEVSRQSRISGRIDASAPRFGGDWVVTLAGEDVPVHGAKTSSGYELVMGGKTINLKSAWLPGSPVFEGIVAGQFVTVTADRLPEGYRLSHDGNDIPVLVRSVRGAELARLMPVKVAPDTSKLLLCPMPGLVVSVDVTVGEEVKAGQTLAVVEAMKMENILRAVQDGVVIKIHAERGQSMAVDAVIMEFE